MVLMPGEKNGHRTVSTYGTYDSCTAENGQPPALYFDARALGPAAYRASPFCRPRRQDAVRQLKKQSPRAGRVVKATAWLLNLSDEVIIEEFKHEGRRSTTSGAT